MDRRKELMDQYISKGMLLEDLIEMIVSLEKKIEYVYVLWDATDDWMANGSSKKLHSIYATEEAAKKVKEKQWQNGEFFFIERKIVNK